MHKTAIIGLILAVSAAAQSPLTTTYSSNNGGSVGGQVLFDLTCNFPVSITGLEVNLGTAASTPGSIDIYRIAGTWLGNENNQPAWTLVGSGTVVSAGLNVPSVVTLNAPFTLGQGNHGIAFVAVGHSHRYTNGTGTNQTYSTTEMTLTAGGAKNVAWTGSTFNPRVVNCTIHYSAQDVASATPYGEGCYTRAVSFYESFPIGVFDLAGTAATPNVIQLVPTGTGYLALQGTPAWTTPSPSAINLGLADDAISGGIPLPFTLNYPGGTTNTIVVESNGNLWLQQPVHASLICDTTPAALLSRGGVISVCYNDLDPTPAVGGGAVLYEFDASGNLVVTWDQIPTWIATPPPTRPTSTFQAVIQPSGTIELRYQVIDTTLSWTSTLTGFSPGTNSVDPGPIDISAALPFQTQTDTLPLTLGNTGRPVIGSSMTFDVSQIPATSPGGLLVVGITQFNPGIDLTSVGAPGCFQFASVDVIIQPLAFTGPTASHTVAVPNVPALNGLHAFAQVGAIDPGQNLLGALTSNGLDLKLGLN